MNFSCEFRRFFERITSFDHLIDIVDPFVESVPEPGGFLADGNIQRVDLCHLFTDDGTDFRIG